MAFLPRFFNGGTHTITSTLAQYDPRTPLPPSNPDIFISFLSWGGRGSGSASVAYGSPMTAAIDMAAIDRVVHCSAAPFFIFAIFSGMQSEKSDGQRREGEGRVLFTATRPSPPHLHYGFTYSAHFVGSTLLLLFGCGSGRTPKSPPRSGIDSLVPPFCPRFPQCPSHMSQLFDSTFRQHVYLGHSF